MKIALLGYGKMGKELERVAISRGHNIYLKITSSNTVDLNPETLSKVDIAIEFTSPSAVVKNISVCLDAGIPLVVGTTGWYEQLEEIKELCGEKNGALFYASNFSIGVNIFFETSRSLAALMDKQQEYEISIEETHHTQKKDAPSGTAITLAGDIIRIIKRKNKWISKQETEPIPPDELEITSHRIEDVTGTHVIAYTSENDQIILKHEAFNRKGFAEGAIAAAEWLNGKKGFFTMRDMLNLNK
jgi:4-hydroxy-tetrahydrodipicolinate reductase